jgi:hypothetical protein
MFIIYIYIMHINFDSDGNGQFGGKLTKDNRKVYLGLCSQLTSRNETLNYPKITQNLMDYLERDAIEKIEELTISTENKDTMKASLNTILDSTDNEDTNYIGRINIVSLQVIILFTLNAHPIGTKFKNNLNNPYECYEALVTKNWIDYNVVKNFLTNDIACGNFSVLYMNNNTKTAYTTSTSPDTLIFLITIIDYLSLDEIITSFLNNIIICGVASTLLWADGRHLTPFEFLEHDITHGNNYQYACQGRQSRDEMLSFYNFCKSQATKKDTLYSIKFIMFLLIHESFCNFFNKTMKKLKIEDIVGGAALPIERFYNENDLRLIIPKKFRKNEKEIKKYFIFAIKNYLEYIKKWADDSRMLYILGVTDNNIKDNGINQQLNSIVTTYIGVSDLNDSKFVKSRGISGKDESNWFVNLKFVINNGISDEVIKIFKNIELFTHFFDDKQKLKLNTFLLEMKYTAADKETDTYSAKNIKIMFFNADGSISNESVNIDINNNKISSSQAKLVPISIRTLIEDVTGIVIQDSGNDNGFRGTKNSLNIKNGGKKRKTKNEKRKTKNEKRKTKNEKRKN